MSFIDQHQVVLFKAVHRDGFDFSFFSEFVNVDNHNGVLFCKEATVLLEHGRGNGGELQLLQMLAAHALIGR